MAADRDTVHHKNGVTPMVNSQKRALLKSENTKDSDKTTPCRTPIRLRRIAPEIHRNSALNAAWDNQNSNCDNIIDKADFIEHDIVSSRKCSSGSDLDEEEKSVLLNSKNTLIKEGLNSPRFTKDLKTCSKYITLPNDGDLTKDTKLCLSHKGSQYENLISPVSTSPSSRDNDMVSIEIMNNIKKRQKQKKSYMKFFCPPYFILIASLLEITVFLWGGKDLGYFLVYSPHNREQVWRFISYMLLHSGGIHLTLNIIIQILLATPLEVEQGSWRCAVVYMGGVLAGALGASVLQPTLYMVGASAGVYALLMSHLSTVAVSYSKMRYTKFRIFAVVVLAGSDVAFLIAHRWSGQDQSPRIGWAAHCAGAVAGIALGLLVFTGPDKQTFHIKVARWISIATIFVGVAASVLCNIFLIKT